MKRHRKFRRAARLLVLASLGTPFTGMAAFADSVPESIRIQERAERAYESSPVVPIDRANAHHRDFQKDDEQGTGDLPATNLPAPRATDQHGSNK
jgi:hypothetical protein